MVRVRSPDPGQPDAPVARGPRQVGVLAAVADVVLAEPSERLPGRRGDGEGKRPEEVVVAPSLQLSGRWRRAGGMRVGEVGEVVGRVGEDALGEVGDRSAEQVVGC